MHLAVRRRLRLRRPQRSLALHPAGRPLLAACGRTRPWRHRPHRACAGVRGLCGGGRLNPVLAEAIASRLSMPVETAEAVGWRGDAIEAEAFAFLAARTARGLPDGLVN